MLGQIHGYLSSGNELSRLRERHKQHHHQKHENNSEICTMSSNDQYLSWPFG